MSAVENALHLLRFGPPSVGLREAIFSHLVFDGWRLIMNGMVRLARNAATVKGCPLVLPVMPAEKHAELEFYSVDTAASLLAVAHELLQQWPDRFLRFCRANELGLQDWVRPRENAPYWLHRVLKSELDMTRYSVTAEEIHGAKKWLERSGGPVKARDVISTLGVKSRPRLLSKSLSETDVIDVDVDQLIEWLDFSERFRNIDSFIMHRTRAYIGLMLISPLTHRELCSLSFDHTISDNSSFYDWALQLGAKNIESRIFRRAATWYFAYLSERLTLEEKHGDPHMLFCKSNGGAINISLAIKSISRYMKSSGLICRGNLRYRC